MKKEMLINVMQPEECRIAILESGVLEELYIERASQENFVGNIYKGRIVNIEPSIQAAFVDFGVGRNGFLHISDVEPAYYRHLDPEGSKYDTGEDEPRGDSPAPTGKRRESRGGNQSGRGRDGGSRNGGRGGRNSERDQERKKQLYQDLVSDLESASPGGSDEPGAQASVGTSQETSPESIPGTENEKSTRGREQNGGRRRGGRGPRGRRAILESDEGQAQPGNAPTDRESPKNPGDSTPPPFMGSTEHRTSRPDDDDLDDLVFTPKRPIGQEETETDSETAPVQVPVKAGVSPVKAIPKVTIVEQTAAPAPQLEDDDLVFNQRPISSQVSPVSKPDPESSVRNEGPITPKVIQVEVPSGSTPLADDIEEENLIFQSRESGTGQSVTFDRSGSANDETSDSRGTGDYQPSSEGNRREREGRGRGERGPRESSEGSGREFGRGDSRQRPRRPSRDSGRIGGGEKPKPPIQDVFKRGQEVIVQVIKEGIGNKGPTLSTYISIAGRYLVLMPGMNRIGVSRKILDDDHRRKSKEIFNDLRPPKGLGFIIRTAGVGKSKMELQRDLAYLSRLWQVVARRVKKVKSPAEVFQESDIITRTIRDTFTTDIETIWVDDRAAFEHAQEFMHFVMPKYAERIKFHEGREPLFHKFGIEDEITKMHQKKVPLPNGGSIIIEQTEALVAIDVNSGNFRTDGNNSEETAYQMNLAAAKEIGRQLRLRDLGGVIINDFIDMREEKHRRGVEKAMREAVRRDRARTKVLRISAFGLIEMTRQRIRPSLKRSLFTDCPACRSLGYVKTVESMSLEVLRLLQLATCKDTVRHVLLRLPNGVAEYLLNRKRKELHRLEELGSMNIEILGVPATNPEFIEITAFDQNRNEVRILAAQPETGAPRQIRR